jgi:hypothetical protein
LLTTVLADSASGQGLVTTYYVIAIVGGLGAIVGGPVAALRFFARQRSKWLVEGESRAQQTQALDANTQAAEDNTKAIREMGRKLETFAESTHEEFGRVNGRISGLSERVTLVEVRQSGPNQRRDGTG